MSRTNSKTARGAITVVQEYRFKLATDAGGSLLFVLDRSAPLEVWDLQSLQRSRSPVAVRYTDADDLIAGVAYDVVRANRRRGAA